MKLPPLTKCLLTALALFVLAQTVHAGKLRRLVYSNYSGTAVTNLFTTNNAGVQAFPDSPDDVLLNFLPPSRSGVGVMDLPNPPYLVETVTNFLDNYGSLVEGYLTAPETGAFTFWLASDDDSQFFMTAEPIDSPNPPQTNLICSVTGWTNPREYTKYPEQQSAPVNLVQGKTYYVKILHKDGTGGDHISLGWQTPSGLLQRPMPAWHFQPIPNNRYGEPDAEVVLGPVLPKTVGGYTYTDTLFDGMQVVVYANVNLPQPVTYQWLKSVNYGPLNPIPGATSAYYLFRVSAADVGSGYAVRVTAGGNSYTTTTAYISGVYPDAPEVVSAGPLPQNPTRLQVVFSEDITPASATALANYNLVVTNSNTTIPIQSATLGADGRTVTLLTGLLPATNGVYNLTINNIQDMAGNTMQPPASTNFVIADGSVSFRAYYTSYATDLAGLRTWSATASTAPSYTTELFDESRLITTNSYPWNLMRDNYMGQLIGYLTPPESGNYKFAIASDDHGVLYLGTNDLRASKREICNYNGSTSRWNLGAQTGNQISTNVYLEGGKRYYFEAVYRDGTGGDGATVAWLTPSMVAGGTTAFPTDNVEASTRPFIIPAQYMSPFSAYGNVFFRTNLAATLSAAAATRPTLRVTVDGSLPYSFQWFKGSTPIPGATSSSYTLPFLTAADSGSTFSVQVTNNFSSTNSTVATLTVTADTAKPTVASVGSLYKQTVEVRFSEPVSATTSGNSANYLLLNAAGAQVAVNSVTLDGADPTHVTLQTAAMPDSDLMKLVVTNVADLASTANVMNPGTNTFRANNFDALVRIGNTQPYNAVANGDQITLTSGGSDLWGTADQCAYLYKSVSGNFDYKVQGVSLQAINAWTKMGLMARASTAAGARNAAVIFTPSSPAQNTYSAQVREATGGTSTSSGDVGSPLNLAVQTGVATRPTVAYPSWVRLQRIGDSIYYYYGSNGTNWTFWDYYDSTTSPEGALPAAMQIGLTLSSHDTGLTADGAMASFIAVNDGALRFLLQPTNTTVVEGANCTFAVTAAGGTPYFYQWFTNNTPVTDATNASLSFTQVPSTLNGLQVACRISNFYNESVTSTNATLTVLQDKVAPTVRYYVTPKLNRDATTVKLLYSEPMNKASAENPANYQVTPSVGGTPLAISSAVLDADQRTVTLTTAPQTQGTLYKVVVNNVTDQACCPPNPVAPNSTDYFFFVGTTTRFTQRSDGFIMVEAENAQRLTTGTTPATDWMFRTIKPGYSGAGYMVVTNVGGTGGGTTPISGGLSQGTGPRMEFDIYFTRPTTNYTLWVRGWVQDSTSSTTAGNDDSIFVGWDGNLANLGPNLSDVNYSQMTGWGYGGWDWRSDASAGADPFVLTNVAPGLHTLVIWQREDGCVIDKICIEPGVRTAAGNSTEPTPATASSGLGDLETWEYPVAPPAAPTISISSPVNSQIFAAGSSVAITTTITGSTPAAMVEFLNGTNRIGTATAAPFAFTWQNVPEGIYSLTARVTDVLGYQATSAAVSITVDSTKPVVAAVGSLRGDSIGLFFNDISGLDSLTATNLANYLVNDGAVTVTNATLEPNNLVVMLALNAPISGQFSVKVQNVADRGFGPSVIDPVTLQGAVTSWATNHDIGTLNATNLAVFSDPILPGLAQAIGADGMYIRAGGSDIWNNNDAFHFAYMPVTGNFDVVVRVASVSAADPWSKGGLMVREDLSAGSRNFLAASAPTNGQNLITMQWRPVKGAGCTSIATRPAPTPLPNCWLRMTRTNDLFSFYWGSNNVNWASLWVTNMSATPYPGTVYVGLAATSHNNATNANQTAAYFRDLSGLVPPAPTAPKLQAQVLGSSLVLSWTSSSSSFVLESSPSLAPAAWQAVSTQPVANGNTYTVTLTGMAANAQFYRLRWP